MLRYILNIGSFFMPLDKETLELADDLLNFMQEKFGFDTMPSVSFVDDEENGSKILGYTGHYDPESGSIVIYITGRHPKDILRSLAHEITHHVQSYEGMNDPEKSSAASDPNYIMYDDHLRKIEADAFERGNIAFREWEAGHKGYKDKKKIDEAKEPRKGTEKHRKYKSGIRKFEKGASFKSFQDKYGEEKGEQIYYGTATNAGKRAAGMKVEEKNMSKDGKQQVEETVEVNEALKNSLSYLPEERVGGEVYNAREEIVFNELLRKFGIKKQG